MLSINNLKAGIENKIILNNLNLKIKFGEIHAIMGPNGSGKSTLSSILAGRKNYIIISGEIIFKKNNLLAMNPEDRAREGLFIAFQHPIEIPGVDNKFFLKTSINAIRKYRNQSPLNSIEFSDFIKEKIDLLKISSDILSRSINVGFSGGEKKRNDILQMVALEPDLCVLDEIDSGLDIDALKIVTNGINSLRNKKRSFIIITHYQRILDHIKPDYVHILNNGQIVKSGDFSLVKEIEKSGYEWII